MTTTIGDHGHRFPPAIIARAEWLHRRLTLSYRAVEDFLTESGIIA